MKVSRKIPRFLAWVTECKVVPFKRKYWKRKWALYFVGGGKEAMR